LNAEIASSPRFNPENGSWHPQAAIDETNQKINDRKIDGFQCDPQKAVVVRV